MGLKGLVVFSLVAIRVLGACDNSDRAEARRIPDAGIRLGAPGDLDASPPDRHLDAAAGETDAPDAAGEPPPQQTTCQALSNACPFVRCEDPASTLSAASGKCGAPPFLRSVTQGFACGRTFVAYRYGAGDTAIAFFDIATGELTGWWNESDTGSIDCSGEVDLPCAKSIQMSLSRAEDCPPDAGAGGVEDAGAADSGS
jgi:hypothetical protein